MYYHVDPDQWLSYSPIGPSPTPEKGKHARQRSVERIIDIGGKIYNKVKEGVEAGTEELARDGPSQRTIEPTPKRPQFARPRRMRAGQRQLEGTRRSRGGLQGGMSALGTHR